MKNAGLLASLLISDQASASHFRAGSLSYLQRDSTSYTVVRTQSWRRSKAGYGSRGCTKEHVLSEKLTAVRAGQNSTLMDICELQNRSFVDTCKDLQSSYVVTDIEDKQSPLNNYCYGYGNDVLPKPAGPFMVKIESCCWVNFMNDFGRLIGSGSPKKERNELKLIAKINELENNTPLVKVPPIWRIMSGCPDQILNLNPVDLDGDLIRCRWATAEEAKSGSHDFDEFASLTLDREGCRVIYDGTKDSAKMGYKPIAVMVEDIDDSGRILSSIPVQFLAEVWIPQPSKFGGNIGRKGGKQIPIYKYPDPYEGFLDYEDGDDHDDHEDYFEVDNIRVRRQAEIDRTITLNNPQQSGGIPGYCDAKPVLVFPSPPAGSTIVVNNMVEIKLKAESRNGDIKRFLYNKPRGMDCTPVTKTGTVTCTWTPAQSQNGIFNFCFWADDVRGLTTERRCINLRTEINDIYSMIDFYFDKSEFNSNSFRDYGCTGKGNMKPEAPSAGVPLDEIDHMINNWKHCTKCALKKETRVAYDFDEMTKECINQFGSLEHSLCSCDLDFVENMSSNIGDFNPEFLNYPKTECKPFPPAFRTTAKGACCMSSSGVFSWYNTEIRECCFNGLVRDIGEC